MRSERRVAWVAAAVLVGVAGFWLAVAVASAEEPGYSQRRDYVSTLASRGAEYGWLGVVAIVAAGGAMIGTALVLRPLSRVAAVLVALAGACFVVAAFTRLDCPNGAAGCGLGGRFEISGGTEIGHWTATTVGSILLIAGIALTGLVLIRGGHRAAGIASIGAAAVTAVSFLVTGGDHPGLPQRVGIVAGTGWLAALAIAVLRRKSVFESAS